MAAKFSSRSSHLTWLWGLEPEPVPHHGLLQKKVLPEARTPQDKQVLFSYWASS